MSPICYSVLLLTLTTLILVKNTASADPITNPHSPVPNPGNLATAPHHNIAFDNLGQVAASMAYIHVAIPLNLSSLLTQSAQLHAHFLNLTFVAKYMAVTNFKTVQAHSYASQQISEIAKAMNDRLTRIDLRIAELRLVLPKDSTLTLRAGEVYRNKRYAYPDESVLLNRIVKSSSNLNRLNSDVLTQASCFPLIINCYGFVALLARAIRKLKTNRQKRALPLLALAAGAGIFSGFVGTFMGSFNAAEIANLQVKVKSNHDTLQNLVIVTENQKFDMFHTNQLLEKVVSYIHAQHANNPAAIMAKLEEQLDLFSRRVDRVVRACQQMHLRRLSIDLLEPVQLINTYNEVRLLAEKRGYNLLSKVPSDLLQLETTYLRQGEDIVVVIHVPCVDHDAMLTLYRFISFPIPLPVTLAPNPETLGQVLIPGHLLSENATFNPDKLEKFSWGRASEALYLVPEAPIIAIGGGQKHRLLTEGQLAQCTGHNFIRLCDKHQVLNTNLHETCLGSMYSRDINGVRRHCRFERRPLKEIVYQLSATEHLVFSPQPLTTQIKCRDGNNLPLHLGQITRIEVPSDCEVTLKSHFIRSDYNAKISPPPLYFKWEWSPLQLPADLLTDAIHLDVQIDKLEADMRKHSKEAYANYKTNSDRLHSAQQQLDSFAFEVPWYFWVLLSFVILILAIFGIGWGLHCMGVHRQAQQRQHLEASATEMMPMSGSTASSLSRMGRSSTTESLASTRRVQPLYASRRSLNARRRPKLLGYRYTPAPTKPDVACSNPNFNQPNISLPSLSYPDETHTPVPPIKSISRTEI